MLIKRLDGKKESAEESSEEYKNAIERAARKSWEKKKEFVIQDCIFSFLQTYQ